MARLPVAGVVRCARRRDWFDGTGPLFGGVDGRVRSKESGAPAAMENSSNSASRWKRRGVLAEATEVEVRSVENDAGRRGW
jgi:hypothetical protein